MQVITQREFRNNSAAVMDAVEAGETYAYHNGGYEMGRLLLLQIPPMASPDQMRDEHPPG